MKTLQIARRFVHSDWGGTETAILETGKCLRSRGHSVEIVCPNALAKTDQESIEGIDVRRHPYIYPYWGLSSSRREQLDRRGGNLFSLSLMRYLQSYKDVDLFHVHTGKRLGGIVRYVARQRTLPYLVTLHGGVHDLPPEEHSRFLAPTRRTIEWGKALGWWVGSRRVLQDAQAVICVGKREQQLTQQQLPHQRVIYLPNGVDSQRFAKGCGCRFRQRYRIPDEAMLVGTIGRIDPQKNQLQMLRCLPSWLQQNPKTHLLLAGHVTDPEYFETLQRTCRTLGCSSQVTLIPGIDFQSTELSDAFQALDVFVLPSIHEPFGIVILEAWSAKRAVVAADVGGISSLVSHNRNGLLFAANDDAQLLERTAGLMNNALLRRRLAEEGYAAVQTQYSWTRVTEQLVQLYEEVLDESHVCV